VIRRTLAPIKALPGGRRLANLAWTAYRTVLQPSNQGPWPRIPLRQHLVNARLWRRFLKTEQYFGGRIFYQSCEPLGLPGQRPTDRRAELYGIDDLVKPTDIVLDIGCNTGFFSMRVAKRAARVDALEKNEQLIEVARRAASFLGVTNVAFSSGDFNEFSPRSAYDVVLAFAVHRWAAPDIASFGERVRGLVKPGGLLFFESNNLARDLEFDGDTDTLCGMGFERVRTVDTAFDCARRLVVLRRVSRAAAGA
jgi:2-polyprenyl-3-methyl-5-hydroxy-6-metoxy-1,4-benzoquinol methylase